MCLLPAWCRRAGKAPQQVEAEIARRLNGKANQPQVLSA